MEGAPPEAGLEEIAVPAGLPIGVKLALTHCRLWEIKGSSFRITCKICGFSGVVSAHKLTYGHYLRQKRNDITSCIAVSKLEEDYPEFYEAIKAKGDSLEGKRK